ncbi:hypothetical protein Ac2012v2_001736 [Leucoagaricus gongylophorus]
MVQQTDVNRLFLQSMLSRGPVPEKLAQTIWKKCVEAVNVVSGDGRIQFQEDGWKNFVDAVNVSLDKLELHFRAFEDQRTGQKIYSIINLKGDAVAQMATEYNPAEIAYFKALVEQIMLAPRFKYSVSSLVAMREISMIKPKINIAKSQVEVVLSTFVARGWFVKSKQILTIGVACVHEGCNCKMHPSCFKKYTKIRKNGTLLCKICEQNWPRQIDSEEFIPIGESAVRKGEQEQRVRSGSASDGEDEDQDYWEENQDPEMNSQSQPQSPQAQIRKTSKSKRKRPGVTVNNGTEEDTPPLSTQRPRRHNRRG